MPPLQYVSIIINANFMYISISYLYHVHFSVVFADRRQQGFLLSPFGRRYRAIQVAGVLTGGAVAERLSYLGKEDDKQCHDDVQSARQEECPPPCNEVRLMFCDSVVESGHDQLGYSSTCNNVMLAVHEGRHWVSSKKLWQVCAVTDHCARQLHSVSTVDSVFAGLAWVPNMLRLAVI